MNRLINGILRIEEISREKNVDLSVATSMYAQEMEYTNVGKEEKELSKLYADFHKSKKMETMKFSQWIIEKGLSE